jgi:hypothetical protein
VQLSALEGASGKHSKQYGAAIFSLAARSKLLPSSLITTSGKYPTHAIRPSFHIPDTGSILAGMNVFCFVALDIAVLCGRPRAGFRETKIPAQASVKRLGP